MNQHCPDCGEPIVYRRYDKHRAEMVDLCWNCWQRNAAVEMVPCGDRCEHADGR